MKPETPPEVVKAEVKAAETAAKLVSDTAELTDKRVEIALTAALKNVFGGSDSSRDPEQMVILVRRIPILCTNVENMHVMIGEMKDNITWATRIVVGAVILAGLALIIK